MQTQGFSPLLPLTVDVIEGPYKSLKTVKDVIKQNLKMLVLTAPGERIMIPNYGVGLRNYLFSQYTDLTKDDIRERILEQVSLYMPFLQDMEVEISESIEDNNAIAVRISYFVSALGQQDFVDFALSPQSS